MTRAVIDRAKGSGVLSGIIKAIGVILALCVALVLLIMMAYRDFLIPHEREAIVWCRADYARARTAAESAAVDARRPTFSRGDSPGALDCGTRRRAGQL